MRSAARMARLKLDSLSPTYLLERLLGSSLRSGRFHSFATAFAASDFPQPGTPSSSTPRGNVSPNFPSAYSISITRVDACLRLRDGRGSIRPRHSGS
jgi:hypothetical protein